MPSFRHLAVYHFLGVRSIICCCNRGSCGTVIRLDVRFVNASSSGDQNAGISNSASGILFGGRSIGSFVGENARQMANESCPPL